MIKNSQNSETYEKRQNQNNTERKVILLMGMGLNGISAEGWLPPADTKAQGEEEINDLWSLLDSVDTFILGRVTFLMWQDYWPLRANDPSSSPFQKKFSLFADQVHKLVFSTTLKDVNWKKSQIINEDISSEISRLKKLPGKNIAIVGGAGIAQTFTKLNLIDEYQLYLHQVIFGAGKSLLGVLDKERQLDLVEAKIFDSGGIRLHFRSSKE